MARFRSMYRYGRKSWVSVSSPTIAISVGSLHGHRKWETPKRYGACWRTPIVTWRRPGSMAGCTIHVTIASKMLTVSEPMSGNALLGYARLDIPDGLWHLYNEP